MHSRHFVAILVLLALLLPTSPAQAGGVVTVCDEAHLRAALASGGTVTFACSGIIALTTTITIATDTTIDGSGQDVDINGNHSVRVFKVNSGVTLSLSTLTVTDGTAGSGMGGGILNNGTVNIDHSTIAGNNARWGGGIANIGTLIVSNSTFYGNEVSRQGGGVYSGGAAIVVNSTFKGNGAQHGGGIYSGGAATVISSTFSGNGGIGSGVSNGNGVVTLNNTIIVNQIGGNCSGRIIDGGGNLSYPDTTCPGVNTNPMLGPLQDNGGPTWTMALGRGSAAIDAGNDATCVADPVSGLDQRGVVRPQGAHCDIGAIEQAPYPPLPPRLWLPAILSQS